MEEFYEWLETKDKAGPTATLLPLLKNYYAEQPESEVAPEIFALLETTARTKEFTAWLETKNAARPAATLLPLLKDYYAAQDESWEQVSANHQLSFLLGSWEQRVYWWEVVEVIRRLLLSGVLVLLGPGSVVQGAVSILICVASVKAYSLYAPFREDDDDYLQVRTG